MNKKYKPRFLYGHTVVRAGRNNEGKKTTRHKGGGLKNIYRKITFVRKNTETKGFIKSFMYDPFRNTPIMLVFYNDGHKELLLKPRGVNIGDVIFFSNNFVNTIGGCTFLKNIPTGTRVYNIESKPKNKNTYARSANCFGLVLGQYKKYIIVKLPSKKIMLFLPTCKASIGQVDVPFYVNKKKNAGFSRLKGKRPTVRGVAMNPCDHPHGGGEGKSPIGRKYPMTPWGKHALGVKTSKKLRKYLV